MHWVVKHQTKVSEPMPNIQAQLSGLPL